MRNGHWIDQMRGDRTEWPLDRSGEWRWSGKETGIFRRRERVRNSQRRYQVRGDSAEQPLEIAGEGGQRGTATGDIRFGETARTATEDIG